MTGLAQISGLRGAGACLHARTRMDLRYVEEASVVWDLMLLGLTVRAVLRGAE